MRGYNAGERAMSDTWRWEICATRWEIYATTQPSRDIRDSGPVEAEVKSAGEAILWCVEHGPFWGNVDQYKAVEISVHPTNPESERPPRLTKVPESVHETRTRVA